MTSLTDCYDYITRYPLLLRLFNNVLGHFAHLIKFTQDVSDTPVDVLVLITGSSCYYNSLNKIVKTRKTIFIADLPMSSRRLPPSELPLQRLRHQSVGGATNYTTVVGFNNLQIQPIKSKLRRTLNHYIDYGIRPHASSQSSSPLTIHHILGIHQLRDTITYQTYMTASGQGFRQLTAAELGCIFGLDQRHSPFTSIDSYPILPIQPLDAILRPALSTCNQCPSDVSKLEIPTVPIPTFTYFPTLAHRRAGMLPTTWSQVDYKAHQAAKNDNAEPVFRHWNERILLLIPDAEAILDPLRRWIIAVKTRRMFLEFVSYLSTTYGHNWSRFFKSQNQGGDDDGDGDDDREFFADVRAGTRAIFCYSTSDYFTWTSGSTLHFWRWAPGWRKFARDGFEPFQKAPFPKYKRPPPRLISLDQRPLFFSKLIKFIQRRYIFRQFNTASVQSYVDYFAVPKGEDDLRPVFNGTSCGLNEALWSPNFFLPSASSLCECITYNYQMIDLDFGEMFLNFPSNKKMIAVSGIDLTPFKEQIREHFPEHITHEKQKLIYQWTRTWMGLKHSPFHAARYFYLMEEFIIGNPSDENNAFRWDSISLNLPGSDTFNPALPFVIKWDELNSRIAAVVKAYVDDLRVAAANIDLAWKAARQIASRIEYLGSQDAPRKRRVDKGPWAGTVFNTENGAVTLTVTQQKWDKAKKLVQELKEEIAEKPIDGIMLNYKRLEQIRGFLCHLAMTHSVLFPYLKGFHLTLSSHLKNRDDEGWKLTDLDYIAYLEDKTEKQQLTDDEKERVVQSMPTSNPKPPIFIKPVKLFFTCLEALDLFFRAETPPLVYVRTEKVFMAVYGFMDASGSGFGSSFDRDNKTTYRMGVWGKDDEHNSSNWKEFQNFVESLEHEYSLGTLDGALMILAVDNATVESCIYKGNSSSPKLYDLILRFKKVELDSGAKFIVSHVSGNRMKKQGTDGISRGSFNEGITLGQNMLSFCPWHLTCRDQNENLKPWIETWTGEEVEFLCPYDWFTRGHDWNGFY